MKIKTFESYDWVDAAKGIGIILVVAGHTLDEKISNIIFLFHMPFFFCLVVICIVQNLSHPILQTRQED